jgi:peptidoglycan hydrolase CwlO-like protein
MKYFLTFIISLIFIIKMNGQYNVNIDSLPKQELPTWFIHNGDTVGLIFSIQQVQKIDSDLELLSWLEKKGFTCDSTIAAYIKVIDEYGKQVTILKTNISELSKQIIDKDSQITNLKKQADNYKKELDLANNQISNYETVVSNNNIRITNLKIQRNLSIGGGVFLTAAAVAITFFIIR